MKLLRCFVQNYGKLHEFEYDFNNGLNIILQENGWGKSTFASFVKSMLFGLPITTKRDIDQNERIKYKPWQGGAFGGWIEFSIDGTPYRIERTFGETKAKDKVTVYDLKTNQPIDDANFVENKLGLNADTFMRSTFVEQGVFSSASDESIKARLGKLIQNDNNFELSAVDKKLLETQVSYKLLKGKGGKIYALETEQDETRQQIAQATTAGQQIQDLTQQIEDLNKRTEVIDLQIKALRDTQDKLNEQKIQQGMREYYQTLRQDTEKAKARYEENLSWFGTTPPTSEEMNDISALQRKEDQQKLKLEALNSDRSTQRLDELKVYFANGEPSEQELNTANKMLKKLRSIPANEGLKPIDQPTKSTRGAGIVSATIGSALLIAGIVLGFVMSHLIIGIAGLVLGLGLIGIGLYHILKKPENLFNIEAYQPTGERRELEQKLSAFVSKFNESTDLLEDSLYNIRYKKQQFADLKNSIGEILTQKEQLLAELQTTHDTLTQFYARYLDDCGDFTQSYTQIMGKFNDLQLSQKLLADKQQALADFQSTRSLPTEALNPDAISADDESVIRQQIVEHEAYKTQILDQQNRLQSQIYSLSKVADNLDYYVNKDAELTSQIAEATHRWNIIKLTREYLQIAKDNLTSKYLAPLCDAFNEYSLKLLGKKFDSFSIDTDLKVLIEEQGAKMDTKYFSQGIRDIIELCLRLALVKVLFAGSMPPIILDDPFYNLDDKKMKNAMKLIHELSDEIQIVYLACHSSRA